LYLNVSKYYDQNMKRKNLFTILFIVIMVSFCPAQAQSEHKNTFIIDNYNYNSTKDGLLLNDIKIILKTRNHETSTNDGKKIILKYDVISNVDIRYNTDSYRYKGNVYKLSDIGLGGYKPAVKHRVFTNFGNNWEGTNEPFGYAGLDALKYVNQSNMDTPYDITLIKITKAYITDSRNNNVEAQIESYLKKKKRAEKEKEVQKQQETVVEKKPRKKKEIRMATDDDFWSGESTTNSKKSEDDFWSGEESTTQNTTDGIEKKINFNSNTNNTAYPDIEIGYGKNSYTVKYTGTNKVLLSVDKSKYGLELIKCADCAIKNKFIIRKDNSADTFVHQTLIDLNGKEVIGPFWTIGYIDIKNYKEYKKYIKNLKDYNESVIFGMEYLNSARRKNGGEIRVTDTRSDIEYKIKVYVYDMNLNLIDSFEDYG